MSPTPSNVSESDGIVHETVDRSSARRGADPAGVPAGAAGRQAHDRLGSAAPDSSENGPTDDAEVVQRAGGTVRVVAGDMLAHKLTVPGDLMLLEALLTTETGNSQ